MPEASADGQACMTHGPDAASSKEGLWDTNEDKMSPVYLDMQSCAHVHEP